MLFSILSPTSSFLHRGTSTFTQLIRQKCKTELWLENLSFTYIGSCEEQLQLNMQEDSRAATLFTHKN
jgi:hypothetical protein